MEFISRIYFAKDWLGTHSTAPRSNTINEIYIQIKEIGNIIGLVHELKNMQCENDLSCQVRCVSCSIHGFKSTTNNEYKSSWSVLWRIGHASGMYMFISLNLSLKKLVK